jgi:hypothetical protein
MLYLITFASSNAQILPRYIHVLFMLGQMFCFKVSSPFTSSSKVPHLRDMECVLYPSNDLLITKDHIGLAKYVYKKIYLYEISPIY